MEVVSLLWSLTIIQSYRSGRAYAACALNGRATTFCVCVLCSLDAEANFVFLAGALLLPSLRHLGGAFQFKFVLSAKYPATHQPLIQFD